MVDEDLRKLYDLVDELADQCKRQGEISLAEIEKRALDKGLRPAAVLDELALSELVVSLAEGKVRCR